MGNKKDKVPKGTEKLLKMIIALEPQEFIGVCKILGIEVYDVVAPVSETDSVTTDTADGRETAAENQKRNINVVVRPAEILIDEVIDKIVALNRVQRRNLQALISSAVRGRKRWR